MRAGDVSAAAAFHDRLRPVVDRTLCRLVGASDPDYDDLAQVALVDLTLSVDRFRGECPLEAWASVVTARVVYRHIRRRKLERRLFTLEPADLADLPGRGTAATIMHRAILLHVQRHLQAMDANRVWTFLLHDVYGYNLDETAAITGVSNAAAQSRLVRGRKWLHQRIAEDEELRDLLHDATEGGPP
jgi:RNA polymerase sigma-70 factor (ECF subfamily)